VFLAPTFKYAQEAMCEKRLLLKRREFLKNSLAVGVAASFTGVAFLESAASEVGSKSGPGMFNAQMIWCAESVPVPLKANGPASGIASSLTSHSKIATSDLHAVFAREFTLDALPTEAAVRLFAYTRYRLYVNGVYCGRGPSRFQNQRPEYDTRDVCHALTTGRNLITVLVHRDAPTGRIMRHEPGFAACIDWSNGAKRQVISTDALWVCRAELSFGPRDQAWSSIEEHIDGRKALDLTDLHLSLSEWSASVPAGGPDFFPVWPRTTPLQSETLHPWNADAPDLPHRRIDLQPGREAVFTMNEIIQGYHIIEFDAEAGSELEISYQLPENSTSGTSTYVARHGVQTWMGGDTFAFNRLTARTKSGRFTLRRAEAFEVRYPFTRVGSFACSDPLLNQLWTICARSLELLSEDSYVDCADRERVEWTDDSPPAFDCTRVMMRGPEADGNEYWGDSRLLKALLRRIALTLQGDGQMKAHSCSERWDIHAIMEDRSCDWVILLRQYVESSGDVAFANELWPALTRLMAWYTSRRSGRGLVQAREWEVWDNPLRYQVCEGAGLNAFVYKALRDAAWLGGQIGMLSASRGFASDADRLRTNFNSLLWTEDEGSYYGGLFGPGSRTSDRLDGKMFTGPFVDGRYQPTAQAALFALYAGIVPAKRVEQVRHWLLEHLDGVRGPMSHYYLFHALYEMENEKRDKLVLERMRAGWKLQVESPWQTTWEDLPDNGGSKAHMYGMVPGYFLSAHVLGARREGHVMDRSILIEPRCGELMWAQGVAVTEFGPVKMSWSNLGGGGIKIQCSVPANTTAHLRLYKRGSVDRILVDGQVRAAKLNGNFLETAIGPGTHEAQYPA
jgi:alpha-L-rhamnosidase